MLQDEKLSQQYVPGQDCVGPNSDGCLVCNYCKTYIKAVCLNGPCDKEELPEELPKVHLLSGPTEVPNDIHFRLEQLEKENKRLRRYQLRSTQAFIVIAGTLAMEVLAGRGTDALTVISSATQTALEPEPELFKRGANSERAEPAEMESTQ